MNGKSMKVRMMIWMLAVAAAAGAATVKYDQDAGADFPKFRTVAFADAPSKGADAIADKRIRTALGNELVAKGYEVVTDGEADLALEYVGVVRQRREILDTGGPRFGRNLQLSNHPEGTLVVVFSTRPGGDVVWQGAVTDALASNPEKADKKTEKAIGQLLEKFPSKKKV